MRTEILFNNVDASIAQTSTIYVVDCGQDMRWLLKIKSTGFDGVPKIYIEESTDNVDWVGIVNYANSLDHWLLDDNLIHIRDSYFMGKSLRLRLDPNGNTTGTVYSELVIKTKSN